MKKLPQTLLLLCWILSWTSCDFEFNRYEDWDVDHNDRIDVNEFSLGFDSNRFFDDVDFNGDGFIDATEYDQKYRHYDEEAGGDMTVFDYDFDGLLTEYEARDRLFNGLDRDRSGYLDKREYGLLD